MSAIFPSLPEPLEMGDLFRAFPNTIRPLCEYHDRLLRDWSPLTIGERELIAAYVSGLNACTFCYGAHTLAARAFGIEESVFDGLVDDVDTAEVADKMKPILKYVRKLTLTPTQVGEKDAQAVYDAGWEERALFDAISVCALFNFMNRIVEGAGLRSNPLAQPAEDQEEHMKRMAGGDIAGQKNLHETGPQYTKLLDMWDIPDAGPATEDTAKPEKEDR